MPKEPLLAGLWGTDIENRVTFSSATIPQVTRSKLHAFSCLFDPLTSICQGSWVGLNQPVYPSTENWATRDCPIRRYGVMHIYSYGGSACARLLAIPGSMIGLSQTRPLLSSRCDERGGLPKHGDEPSCGLLASKPRKLEES